MTGVYILKSKKSGKYYIGCSKNITERICTHNLGKVISTKKDRPWELIHSEAYSNLKEARKRERQIKQWKSRAAIEKLINNKFNKIEDPRSTSLVGIGKGTARNMGITIE